MYIPKLFVRPISFFILDRKKRRDFRTIHLKSKLRKIKITGKNNQIFLIKDGKETPLTKKYLNGLSIDISGDNNILKIDMSTEYDNVQINLNNANNNLIIIGKGCHLHNSGITMIGHNQKFIIGNNVRMVEVHAYVSQNSNCIIEDDCLFSSRIILWCGDAHKIKDKDSQRILNEEETTIKIGRHCWIGEHCRLTKHASLADNTIVACSSVITKPFTEEYTVIAGNPAKIVKKNIDWEN